MSGTHRTLSRRGLLGGAGAALLTAPVRSRPARAQAGRRLTFALSSYPPSIRPWQNAGTAAATVKLMLHRGLVSYDAKGELFTVRLTDVVLSFPPILLGLLVVTVLGPGAKTLTLVLAVLYIPGYARVTYGEVLSAREVEYVEAARAAGARPGRILFRTILPNIAGPILVQFSLTVASAIVVESGLSFLGLGVVPPAPSWGLMIRSARSTMEQSWLLLLWPCLALVAAILAVNRLCDALRDVVDPRTYAADARMDRRGRTL